MVLLRRRTLLTSHSPWATCSKHASRPASRCLEARLEACLEACLDTCLEASRKTSREACLAASREACLGLPRGLGGGRLLFSLLSKITSSLNACPLPQAFLVLHGQAQ